MGTKTRGNFSLQKRRRDKRRHHGDESESNTLAFPKAFFLRSSATKEQNVSVVSQESRL